MKLVLILFMALFLPFSVGAQGGVSEILEEQRTYICPMHPHINGEEGSNCPICGMRLALAKVNEVMPNMGDNSIKVDPLLTQAIGVKVATVKMEIFGEGVRAYGRIVPSTRVENKLTLRVEGWVEGLVASALGDPVRKGQLLFNLNSSDLTSAQQDYLTARKLGNTDIEQSALKRLQQLGVSKKAMQLIKKQSAPLMEVPIYAPASGVITKLNIRNGDYIKRGVLLMVIQDLSVLWVQADVPEKDLAAIKIGNYAKVHLPEINAEHRGKIIYIQPVLDPKTRTGQVRIELLNPKGILKPDSFVDVDFVSKKLERLAVPVQAILRNSMGSHVLQWLGEGRFKPVMVTTGAKSGEFVEVIAGLELREEIVISGQFLLDAEANLRSGMGSMTGHNHGSVADKPETGMNHANH